MGTERERRSVWVWKGCSQAQECVFILLARLWHSPIVPITPPGLFNTGQSFVTSSIPLQSNAMSL